MSPQRVGFLPRFGLKSGMDFAHFGLESGMVFEGTTVQYERIYRFSSKWVRKRNMRIWNGFLEVFFCCRSNLSNDDIISKRSGLKMGMDFRGQFWKRVWKMTFIQRTRGAHPHQEFPGVPPGVWTCYSINSSPESTRVQSPVQILYYAINSWVLIRLIDPRYNINHLQR